MSGWPIDNLQTIIHDGDESLARQIANSAGSGQQFDSFSIWYFDKDNEGWTEDDAGQSRCKSRMTAG
jgi:hypothetical protein